MRTNALMLLALVLGVWNALGAAPSAPVVDKVVPLDSAPVKETAGVFFFDDLETISGLKENYTDTGGPKRFRITGTDPFSGKPFHYRREGNGSIVYSVGPNGVDDGGIEDPEDRNAKDIVWKCSR